MAEKKLKPEKKGIPTRAPQKKTGAGIFDNVRQPHPIEDFLAIPEFTMPDSTIPEITIPNFTTVKSQNERLTRGKVKAPKAKAAEIVPAINPARGFLQIFNDIVDNVFPTLPPAEQSVLLRLYRESQGRRRNTVAAGYTRIGVWCNISRSTAQAAIAALLDAGFIEKQGEAREGTIYKVNLPGVLPRTVPDSGIVKSGIPEKVPTLLEKTTVLESGIPKSNHMNINNKEHEINTHTGVSVGSRFSLEECGRFASHLKATGQGITNPGGYATKVFRSGEADTLIEAFLNSAKPVDINQCPDCKGMGMYYLNGIGNGPVAKCKHEKLRTQ